MRAVIELHIQEYLRRRCLDDIEETFASLRTQYGIKAKRHGKYPNLVLFKYDQIASPFSEPIVRECRGIVLDEADDWKIVSRAFDKFFNHGEGHAAQIDWPSARVQEKVDGSLCVLYPYKGEWHVATSGTPDASGEVHGRLMTFEQLFWDTYLKMGAYNHPPASHCFYFELTSPLNRIVVPHAEAKLTLLGARHIDSQKEMGPENAAYLIGVPSVKEYPLGSFEDIAASFEHINPLSQEGYVVVDKYFNRVKVKHPGYVALHHAKDGMSTKAFIDIVRNGERSEVLAAFPEFQKDFDDVEAKFDDFVADVWKEHNALLGIAGQKDFALEAVKTRCSSALFAVRSGKSPSIDAYLRAIPAEKLMHYLGYK